MHFRPGQKWISVLYNGGYKEIYRKYLTIPHIRVLQYINAENGIKINYFLMINFTIVNFYILQINFDIPNKEVSCFIFFKSDTD